MSLKALLSILVVCHTLATMLEHTEAKCGVILLHSFARTAGPRKPAKNSERLALRGRPALSGPLPSSCSSLRAHESPGPYTSAFRRQRDKLSSVAV